MRRLLIFSILVIQVGCSKILSRRDISSERPIALVSPQDKFVVGLFQRGVDRWYLGIWHRSLPLEVVWVANRDRPLSQAIATLSIVNDTKLTLFDQNGTNVWSTSAAKNHLISPLVAEIMDTGNFVLRLANNNRSIWESFNFLGDTLVSTMVLGWDAISGVNRVMRAYTSGDDPSTGVYTYEVERRALVESFIRREGKPILRSDPWKTNNDIEGSSRGLSYMTFSITVNDKEATYSFNITNEKFFSVLRLTHYGTLKRTTWNLTAHGPRISSESELPQDPYGEYNTSGANGTCSMKTSPMCSCLHGFYPQNEVEWKFRNWRHGCERKTKLKCDGSDGFLKMEMMKLPDSINAFVDNKIGLDDYWSSIFFIKFKEEEGCDEEMYKEGWSFSSPRLSSVQGSDDPFYQEHMSKSCTSRCTSPG